MLHRYLMHEVQVLELRNKITTEARTEMSKEQRDYCCANRCGPSSKSWANKAGKRPRRSSCANGWTKPTFPKTS